MIPEPETLDCAAVHKLNAEAAVEAPVEEDAEADALMREMLAEAPSAPPRGPPAFAHSESFCSRQHVLAPKVTFSAQEYPLYPLYLLSAPLHARSCASHSCGMRQAEAKAKAAAAEAEKDDDDDDAPKKSRKGKKKK